jgi:hypothetical protein
MLDCELRGGGGKSSIIPFSVGKGAALALPVSPHFGHADPASWSLLQEWPCEHIK